MHFKLTCYLLVSSFYLLGTPAAVAQTDEWPQFRGPDGQGHSTETGLPLEWSESHEYRVESRRFRAADGLRRSWQAIASGSRQPSSVPAPRRFALLAFDARTGKEVVNIEVFSFRNRDPRNPKNSLASPTPIVDGDRVYVHFGADGTAALDVDPGEIVWKTRLPYQSQHGNGGSPALYRRPARSSAATAATRRLSSRSTRRPGRSAGRPDRRQPSDQAYSTPLVIRVGERDQLVSVGAYRAAAYDPASGQGDLAGSYGGRLLQCAAPGLWPRSRLHRDRIPAAVAARGPRRRRRRRHQDAHRLDAHARARPIRRRPARRRRALRRQRHRHLVLPGCEDRRGPLAAAAGRQFIRRRRCSPTGGSTFSAKKASRPSSRRARTFRKLATNQLDGATLASMAVSGGSIFIRSDRHLYRLGLTQGQASADMVRVPGGTLVMGTNPSSIDSLMGRFQAKRRELFAAESPARTLKVDAFFIDQTEVTNAAFRPHVGFRCAR